MLDRNIFLESVSEAFSWRNKKDYFKVCCFSGVAFCSQMDIRRPAKKSLQAGPHWKRRKTRHGSQSCTKLAARWLVWIFAFVAIKTLQAKNSFQKRRVPSKRANIFEMLTQTESSFRHILGEETCAFHGTETTSTTPFPLPPQFSRWT